MLLAFLSIWSCIMHHFRLPFFLRSRRHFNASISRSISLWHVLCVTVTARCLHPTLMPCITPVARCGSTGTWTAICSSNMWSEGFLSLFTYRVTSSILNERISHDSRMVLAVFTTPNPGICITLSYGWAYTTQYDAAVFVAVEYPVRVVLYNSPTRNRGIRYGTAPKCHGALTQPCMFGATYSHLFEHNAFESDTLPSNTQVL